MNYLRSSMQFLLTCELIDPIIYQIDPTSDLFVLYKSAVVQGDSTPALRTIKSVSIREMGSKIIPTTMLGLLNM